MKQSYTPNETLLWLLILIADTATGVVSFYSWRQNCCCVYPLLCWFLMKIIIVINLCACVSGGLLRITLKERVAMHEDDDSIELESSLFWSDRCNISWVRLRRLRDRGGGVHVWMSFDLELLRCYLNTNFGCALMHEVEQQLKIPAGMNKVCCYCCYVYCFKNMWVKAAVVNFY